MVSFGCTLIPKPSDGLLLGKQARGGQGADKRDGLGLAPPDRCA